MTTTVFRPVGDYYYTASIVLSFLCFFCGSWWALCCTIPAIFVASSVSGSRDLHVTFMSLTCVICTYCRPGRQRPGGDLEGARRSGQMALYLNIAGVVSFVVLWILIIGLAAGLSSSYIMHTTLPNDSSPLFGCIICCARHCHQLHTLQHNTTSTIHIRPTEQGPATYS